jgi:predicted DNA-binding protein with PD1-like motif
MLTSVRAGIGRSVFAQLEPDEDVYRAIVQLIQQEEMRAGLILTITGALRYTRLSMPLGVEDVSAPPSVFEMEGTAEVSGQGYFGMTKEAWSSETSQIRHLAAEPFLHVHMSAGIAGRSYVGHLIDGCKVRSLHPKSHFVVVIAEAPEIELSFRNSGEAIDGYPEGVPYYDLGERHQPEPKHVGVGRASARAEASHHT